MREKISMTLVTACSGSLVAVDVACRYLLTGEISGAIVAGCKLYLNPNITWTRPCLARQVQLESTRIQQYA